MQFPGKKGGGLGNLEYFADILHKLQLPHIFIVLALQMQVDWTHLRKQKIVNSSNHHHTEEIQKIVFLGQYYMTGDYSFPEIISFRNH